MIYPQPRLYLNHYKARSGFTLIELLIVTSIFSLAVLIASAVFIDVQSTQRSVENQQRLTADARYALENMATNIRTNRVYYYEYGASADNPAGNAVPGQPLPAGQPLALIGDDGVVTCYQYDSSAKSIQIKTITPSDTEPRCSSALGWTNVTPSDIQIDDLKFSISPKSDPFKLSPRTQFDCFDGGAPVPPNFDHTLGVCLCGAPSECFPDQKCVVAADTITQYCINPTTQPQVTVYISSSNRSGGTREKDSIAIQTTVTSRSYQP